MEDNFMRNLLLWVGGIIVAFVLFISLVVIPDTHRQHERCEAAGGQIIKGGDCVSKEMFR